LPRVEHVVVPRLRAPRLPLRKKKEAEP